MKINYIQLAIALIIVYLFIKAKNALSGLQGALGSNISSTLGFFSGFIPGFGPSVSTFFNLHRLWEESAKRDEQNAQKYSKLTLILSEQAKAKGKILQSNQLDMIDVIVRNKTGDLLNRAQTISGITGLNRDYIAALLSVKVIL